MKKIKVVYTRNFTIESETKIFNSLINSVNDARAKKNLSLLPDMVSQLEVNAIFRIYAKVHFINNHSNLKTLKILFKNMISQLNNATEIDFTINPKVGFKTLSRLISIFDDLTEQSFFECKKLDIEDFIEKNFNNGIIKTSVTLTVNNDFKLPDFITADSFITAELINDDNIRYSSNFNDVLNFVK